MVDASHTKHTYLFGMSLRQQIWLDGFSTGWTELVINFYRNGEGIVYHNGNLTFISKQGTFRLRFSRHLHYRNYGTRVLGGGDVGARPYHLLATSDGLLFFTKDGGSTPGVLVYDVTSYHAVLEARVRNTTEMTQRG